MNKSFSDAEKLKLLHSGLSTGDFTDQKNSSHGEEALKWEEQQQQQEQQQEHQQQQQEQQQKEHQHKEHGLGSRQNLHRVEQTSTDPDGDAPQFVDGPEPDKLEIDDGLIARVLSSLPKSQRKRGSRVLKLMARYPDKLWFNKDLELMKKRVTIELTNICDLLRDLLQRREQLSPLAWQLFI
jgi:hypothetical protein